MTLVALFSCPSILSANPLNDTHIFRAGALHQDMDISGYVIRGDAPKVELDFDEVFGLDDSITSAFLMYQWRFSERWSLHATYSRLESDGGVVTSRDFNWNGQDYEAGLELESDFKLDTLLAVVNYSFIKDDRKELGAGFGVHAFDIDADVRLAARLEGEDGERSGSRTRSELLAPLPNLRVFGTYLFTERWSIAGSAGWLSFNYDDFDGDYLFLNLTTEYRFTPRFGVGLAYQVSEIDVTNDSNSSEKSFDIDLNGPSIYLTYGF